MTSGVYTRLAGPWDTNGGKRRRAGSKPMFSADQVAAIRASRSQGKKLKELAWTYKVDLHTVWRVVNNLGAYK